MDLIIWFFIRPKFYTWHDSDFQKALLVIIDKSIILIKNIYYSHNTLTTDNNIFLTSEISKCLFYSMLPVVVTLDDSCDDGFVKPK